MKIIVVISARAGSKRLKNKNLSKFEGFSLTERSVKFSLNLFKGSDIILSTNISELEYLKNKYDLIKNNTRPENLCTDHSSIYDVLDYEIGNLDEEITHCILLQPTTPFRRIEDMKSIMKMINRNPDKNIKSALKIDFDKDFYYKNNEKAFNKEDDIIKLNGAYYVFQVEDKKLKRESTFLPYIVEGRKYNIDIDYPEDLEVAKMYAKL